MTDRIILPLIKHHAPMPSVKSPMQNIFDVQNMRGMRNMRTVTVKISKLLQTLEVNRDKHQEEYLVAEEAYRTEVLRALKERLVSVEAGAMPDVHFNLTKPVSKVKDYSLIIGMMKITTDTEMQLSESEFDQYVNDNWSWKEQVMLSNTRYLS